MSHCVKLHVRKTREERERRSPTSQRAWSKSLVSPRSSQAHGAGGELGAPQALPLLLPLSLCHTELHTHVWPLGALPSEGGSRAHPGLCVLPTAAVHRGEGRDLGTGSCRRRVPRLWLIRPFGTRHGTSRARESPRRRKAAGHCPEQSALVPAVQAKPAPPSFRTLHVGMMNVLSRGIRAVSGDGCGKGEHGGAAGGRTRSVQNSLRGPGVPRDSSSRSHRLCRLPANCQPC